MIARTPQPFDLRHLRGVVAVAEIHTDRILYCGRSTGSAGAVLAPGTHFAWGKDQNEARRNVYRQVDQIKAGKPIL